MKRNENEVMALLEEECVNGHKARSVCNNDPDTIAVFDGSTSTCRQGITYSRGERKSKPCGLPTVMRHVGTITWGEFRSGS